MLDIAQASQFWTNGILTKNILTDSTRLIIHI